MNTKDKLIFMTGLAVDALLSSISTQKHREILEKRFGLGKNTEKRTLEAIGEEYGITRERTRQIEQKVIECINQSHAYQMAKPVLKDLLMLFEENGKILSENELSSIIGNDIKIRNQILFLMDISDIFTKKYESDEHFSYWSSDSIFSEKVFAVIKQLYSILIDIPLHEDEITYRFLRELEDAGISYQPRPILIRWLNISKTILRNPLNEWGKHTTFGIKISGVRDYAYLILRKHGTPMHFSEIAEAVEMEFKTSHSAATCHNELIKDDHFVLVGRGIYGLAEKGYIPGTARDVIKQVLKNHGPLSENSVLEKVSNMRFLKKGTILSALKDTRYFATKNGICSLVQT